MSDPIALLADVHLTLTPETRERHMTAIRSAVRSRLSNTGFRRRLLVIAVATLLILPVMALASENAVPGDILYPIKRAIEPVVSLFDRDVAATHRVDEVERLVRIDASPERIDEHIIRAHDAIVDWPHLEARLDRVVDDYRSGGDARLGPVPGDGRSDQHVGDDLGHEGSTRTTQPQDRVETTSPAAGDTQPEDPVTDGSGDGERPRG